MKKNIAIIGSTGSVGRQTLEVIRNHTDKWAVFALAAYENIDLLEEQIIEFRPQLVAVFDEQKAAELEERTKQFSFAPKILTGSQGWIEVGAQAKVDKVLFVSSGVSALPALYESIKSKKEIAIANKEMIVAEGQKIMDLAKENDVTIIPIDSEHSAIFQCLQGESPDAIEKVILTCSGGPFYGKSEKEMENITCEQALNHPTWRMGDKISVDCATLMNKGFEIIEAKHLFGLKEDQIEIVIHPQSIVHSLVQFKDGSVKAQLGLPDMKIPITYALSYPERIQTDWPRMELSALSKLTFIQPEYSFFKGPQLALAALRKGGSAPSKLREANDEAVQKFLAREIGFRDIYTHISAHTGL